MVKEEKQENRGSVEFQVFSFTNKIRRLASHLELHKKDFSSERGPRKLLGKHCAGGSAGWRGAPWRQRAGCRDVRYSS